MERDFLGVGGRNSRAFVMGENLGGRLDSAFSVSSAVHWPFLNRTSALQKFISFETSGEDKRKKLLVEPLSSTVLQPAEISSVDAFKASNTVCSVKATEKSLGMERHEVTQFFMHASQKQTTETHHASTQSFNDESSTAMSHSSIPIAVASPFLKSHSSSNGTNPTATAVKQQPFASIIASNASLGRNVVGAFTPRNAQKAHLKNPQLTIFYAGSVNVYDDVPSHMAQAIMLTASRECKTAISSGHPRSDAAVPQARKASLARFLQKRKERVSNKTPYSFEKKSPDSCVVLEGAPTSSKFSSTDASISSNRCGSWLAGQTKSCSDSDESPSTKLEM